MYGMTDLLSLQRDTRFCTDLTSVEVDYLKSAAYRDDLSRVDYNPLEMARLTCELLKHVALSPTEGTQVKDFVLGYETGNAEGTLYFRCRLHCLANFVGYFELPRDSTEAQQLVDVIKQNLASRKFKAARMYRRLREKDYGRHGRIEKAGRAAYNAVLEKLRPGINFRNESDRFKVEQMYEQAKAAFEAVHAPLKERMQRRLANVCDSAYDPEYRGAYTKILGNFAVRYIRTPLSA